MTPVAEVHSIVPLSSSEDALIALDLWRAYETGYEHLFTPAEIASARLWIDALPQRFADFLDEGGVVSLARDEDGLVIGTVAMQVATPAVALISRLFIPEPLRRSGLGAALLGHVIIEARLARCKIAQAIALKNDKTTNDLMRNVGFSPCGDCLEASIPAFAWPHCQTYSLDL